MRPVVLVGANGAGKTNLLEALSFLAPGRGLRRSRLQDVTRFDAPTCKERGLRWAVAASIKTRRDILEIGTGFEGTCEGVKGGRRLVRLNGSDVQNQSELGDLLATVWLVPEMDRLFTDSASARRLFLDRLVAAFDSAHTSRLKIYQQAMRERTRLLRGARSGSQAVNVSWLDALEKRMTESGIALAVARRSFIQRLDAACKLGVGPFPAAALTLTGDVENWLEAGAALEAADTFRATLAASRAADRESGRALTGPHRSDIDVIHFATHRPAASCSTGEQKALLISIILAHARLVALDRGFPPLLFMDEIVAHLDRDRRVALFDEICAIGAQAWMTGTDRELFQEFGSRAQFFRVENAIVQSV